MRFVFHPYGEKKPYSQIWIKFRTEVDIRDIITDTNIGAKRSAKELTIGQIFGFSVDFRRRSPYNIHTTVQVFDTAFAGVKFRSSKSSDICNNNWDDCQTPTIILMYSMNIRDSKMVFSF